MRSSDGAVLVATRASKVYIEDRQEML